MNINIHGKQYNLENYNNHPGGKHILKLCVDEPDCTALFESYHAFCDMNKINDTMKKYEVNDSYDTLFKFDENGFYNVCKKRVRKYFGDKQTLRKETKANFGWLFTSITSSILFCVTQYFMLYSDYFIIKIISALLSGFFSISLGFNLLHDGSHYAICTNPNINIYLSKFIQIIYNWNFILWSYHHCIRHHQYTGSINYDPDLINTYPFFTKIKKTNKNTFNIKYFDLKFLLFHNILPGSTLGQSLLYKFWTYKKKLWKMKIPDEYLNTYDYEFLFSLIFIIFHIYNNIFIFFIYVISTNIFYFIGNSPDHDMFPTHIEIENMKEDDRKNIDWGEIQVRSSGNFCNSYDLYTKFMGGINFQIEHHLFPTLSNHKLKSISNIVKQTCEEFNIPYNSIDEPYEVYKNVTKTYKKNL